MTTSDYKHKLLQIVETARFAPSVHNAQPWEVTLSDTEPSLLISITTKRPLTQSDATGRETFISLGIFAEACVCAARDLELGLQTLSVDEIRKQITIAFKATPSMAARSGFAELVKNRFTDRSVFKPTPITKDQLLEIEQSWTFAPSSIVCSTDSAVINEVAKLTMKGQQLAFTSDAFRHELAEYIVPTNKSPVGIPVTSLQVGPLKRKFSKITVKNGWFKRIEMSLEYKKWASASGLVFILSEGDRTKQWIDAGRAYLHASLAIQSLGLNQSTSAAVVEASDFHEDIEKLLGTKKRILSIIRIGKGVGFHEKHHSGRLSAEEIIAT